MNYDDIYELSKKNAIKTLWVFSDLQQSEFEQAKRCFDITLNDYLSLGNPADIMLYLGDSTEKSNLEQLEKMTEYQRIGLESLKIPLVFISGNHEYDYSENLKSKGIDKPYLPFYEMVKKHPNWYCAKEMDDTYFKVELNKDYVLYCFTDHIDKNNKWCQTHNGWMRWGEDLYPYSDEHFANVRKEMENDKHKFIITASHYAFPGGNRETGLLSKIQPLPINTKIHLYGHAHLGEYAWPRERVFSSISWIDWQDIPQVDVASIEDVRGAYCRSAIIHLYQNGSMGLFFRNHNEGKFNQVFFTKDKSSEKDGGYYKAVEKYSKFGK